MNKLISNIKIVGSLVGVMLFCSLVWFAGPKVGLSNIWWRLIVILIVLFIVLLIIVIHRWFISKNGAKLHAQLQAQKEVLAGHQLEIAVLKEKMDEAVQALRASDLAAHYRGNAALYALPWYLVIGPAASGKSTLLRNAGLHFSLATAEEIRVKGYGGTRNCDWWFANEAILLDTAGRYTTDSDDHEEWQTFLLLIKKYRPRLPINGILVVISLAELLSASEDDLARHVKIIRARIAEIMAHLGYLFPVTLVFTKIDLLPGFNTFFESLNEEERCQVWGTYLAQVISSHAKAAVFREKYLAFYEKLSELRLSRLSYHADVLDKLETLDFPKQFFNCSDKLSQFISLLFKDNPYEETPVFVGAYFTSATQENAVTSRSYFIQDLFSRVIFSPYDIMHRSRKYKLILRWIKTGVVIVAMLMIITAIVFYSASLTANTLFLRRGVTVTKNTIDVLSQTHLSPQEKLIALEALYSYLENLWRYRDAIPFHLRLGLYRGNELIPPLEDFLAQRLHYYFFVPTANDLEQQLMQMQQSWALATPTQDQEMRGEYYTLLKVYLMLCDPQHLDADLATDTLTLTWSKHVKLPPSLLKGMVHFYISDASRLTWGEKPDLVQLSREQLYTPANYSNLYGELKAKGLARLGTVSVQDFTDNSDELLSARLPVLYTLQGWKNYAGPEIAKLANNATRGDWVMGSYQPHAFPEENSQITQQLTSLYFNDYAQAWCQFLTSVHLRAFASLDDAAKQLVVVADDHGPIAALLHAMYLNLNIHNTDIQQVFHAFMPLIVPGKNGVVSDEVANYLQQVTHVKAVMEKLTMSPDVGRDAQTLAVQLLSGNGNDSELYQASLAANHLTSTLTQPALKQSLQTILLTPLRESWRLVLHEATLGLEQQWRAEVVASYQQSLANRFPFAASNDDASQNDIDQFFNPQHGVLWQFVNRNLMPYLINTQNGWQERTWLDVGAGFSKPFLQSLLQAKMISAGFFAEGSDSPKFSFEIYPEPTPRIQEINLTTNGQTLRYRNDPQEWETIHWPGNEPNDDTVLTIVTAKNQVQGNIEFNGAWGFFQLLQQASLVNDTPGVLRATWKVTTDDAQSYHVNMLVRSQSNDNLFSNLLLNHFSLPTELFIRPTNN